MGGMFEGATNFNNGGQPLKFDTSKVRNMSRMFYGGNNFNNGEKPLELNIKIIILQLGLIVYLIVILFLMKFA